MEPKNNAAVAGPTVCLVWRSAVPTATRYWLELSKDSLFSIATIDTTIRDTCHSLEGLQPGTFYWWRLRACNSSGWGPFGETAMFSVVDSNRNGTLTLPNTYELSQNFPNPFNPTTSITYAVPSESDVEIKVYNLLGQEVATLVSGRLKQGTYTHKFNCTNLASGVYIYSLRAGDYHTAKRMVLLK
jgi:hypothetical protein